MREGIPVGAIGIVMRVLTGTVWAVLALAVSFPPSPARAAGYALFEQGSRALGTAGAFTAAAGDPSAIFFNPAGIAGIPGFRLYGGVSSIVPKLDFAGTAPYPGFEVRESWRDKVLVPVHGYATYALRDGLVAGIGVHVPFGLDSEWRDPDNFSGRYISTLAQIRGYYVNPTLAAEITPTLSAGVGGSLVLADAKLVRRVPFLTFDGSGATLVDVAEVTLDGELTPGVTFNAGLLYHPGNLRVGLSYRHGIENEIDGDVDFEFLPTGDPSADSVLAGQIPRDQRARAVVPFPALLSLGIAYRIGDRLDAEVDLNWTRWSVFDALTIDFEDPDLDVVLEEDYENVFSVRTGFELEAGEKLDLRAGYYFDDVPSSTRAVGPILPDSRRHGITAGFGYHHLRWSLDLFHMFLFFDEREVRDNRDGFNGDYSQRAWVSGLSLGYTVW